MGHPAWVVPDVPGREAGFFAALRTTTAERFGGSGLAGEGGEFVGDAEEEDGADDEAVGDGKGGGDALELRAMRAGGEDAAGAGGHEGVHGEQAEDEAEQAEQASGGAAELGGEQKEEEL